MNKSSSLNSVRHCVCLLTEMRGKQFEFLNVKGFGHEHSGEFCIGLWIYYCFDPLNGLAHLYSVESLALRTLILILNYEVKG